MAQDNKAAGRDGAEPDESSVRELILAAAARLFADRGFEGTKVRQIAEAAGIQMPTIYHYFGNKRGLYEEMLLRQQQYAHDQHTTALRIDASPEERIRRWLEKDVASLIDNDIWHRLLLHMALDRDEELRETLARGDMQRVYEEIRAAMNEVSAGAGDAELPILLMSTSLGFAQLRAYTKYIDGYAMAKSTHEEEEQALIDRLMSLVCAPQPAGKSRPARAASKAAAGEDGALAKDNRKLQEENDALRKAVIELTLEKVELLAKVGRKS